MKCEKCGGSSYDVIFIQVPLKVGWSTYCVACFVEKQRDVAVDLLSYLKMKLGRVKSVRDNN